MQFKAASAPRALIPLLSLASALSHYYGVASGGGPDLAQALGE